MKNKTKAIADDYYINGLTNADIFKKYDIPRNKSNITSERVFEHLPTYHHSNIKCPYCDVEMESSFLGKNAQLADNELSTADSKEIQNIELVRIENTKVKRPWFNKLGIAYLVEDGYRVSSPICTSCGHQLESTCKCDSCMTIKNEKSLEAADLFHADLLNFNEIKIEELSCSQMVSIFKQLSDFISEASIINSSEEIDNKSFEQKLTLMLLGILKVSKESILSAIQMHSTNEYSVSAELIEFEIIKSNNCTNILSDLKLRAFSLINQQAGALDVLEFWESLAQNEAMDVLEHYCNVHDIHFAPGEQTTAAINRSLSRYGLAQTARYIYNAVWRARKYSSENGHNRFRAFSFIYGNLNFWIDDPRARTYNAPPFNRTEGLLSEPEPVTVFSKFFLERNGISYFTDPISIRSLNVEPTACQDETSLISSSAN